MPAALLTLAQLGDVAQTGVVVGLIIFFVVLSVAIFVIQRYRRCPSNAVLVIYGQIGGDRSARCIHGGGQFVWPVIQDFDYLSLEPIQIAVPLQDALSSENIRVNVPSVFTVAIGTEPSVMQNAAIRLLGLNTAQIKAQAEDIIFGQLRQVIASMLIEDINRDREQFLTSIQNSLEPELQKIGLVLINVNITDITDESGYIEAIGRKAASEAVQKARGDVAEQEKLGEVRVADAERAKSVEVADQRKQQEIGVREADREKAVRIAELERDELIGQRAAEFEREAAVAAAEREKRIKVAEAVALAKAGEADAERQRRIRVADAEAVAVGGETESEAKIADAKATLLVKRSEAYELGETRKREAEAAVEEAENRAQAKAAIAEAEKIEAERRAELEAPAKAEKAKTIVEAEAAAAKRRLEAEAEAAAIFAKLDAEARGQYEMLAQKGRGLKEIIEACGSAQDAFQLMLLEHLDELARASAEAISNIEFDKVVVWEGGGGNGDSSTANFLRSMSSTLPPMLSVLKDIGGVELPETLVKLAEESAAEKKESADNGSVPETSPADERPATAKKSTRRKASTS